jgi:hypothetical protein
MPRGPEHDMYAHMGKCSPEVAEVVKAECFVSKLVSCPSVTLKSIPHTKVTRQ